VVNLIAVLGLLLTPFDIAADKVCLTERPIIFRYIDSLFPHIYCLKFSFKSGDISKSYARKQKGLFFWNSIFLKFHDDNCYSFPVILPENKHSYEERETTAKNKNTQRAQTSANAKFEPKAIRDVNQDFRINPNPNPDVCRICPKMLWMHHLVSVSHFAKYGTNRPLNVLEMLTNVEKSPIPQL